MEHRSSDHIVDPERSLTNDSFTPRKGHDVGEWLMAIESFQIETKKPFPCFNRICLVNKPVSKL